MPVISSKRPRPTLAVKAAVHRPKRKAAARTLPVRTRRWRACSRLSPPFRRDRSAAARGGAQRTARAGPMFRRCIRPACRREPKCSRATPMRSRLTKRRWCSHSSIRSIKAAARDLQQTHRVFRSGNQQRDELLSADGKFLEPPVIHMYTGRRNRYAVEVLAPRTSKYSFRYIGPVHDGRHTDAVCLRRRRSCRAIRPSSKSRSTA